MPSHVIKRFVSILILVILLYTGFVVWSDVSKNVQTLRAFPWIHIPVILVAVLINFFLRELKWDFFRRAAGINVPRFGSFLVFFSGFSMAISPARIGELIKPFMYKEYFGQKMRRSVPLVFCERLSDLFGMIVLGAITLVPFMRAVTPEGEMDVSTKVVYLFFAFSIIAMILLMAILRNKRLVYGGLKLFARGQRGRKILPKLRHLYRSTYPLLTARNLIVTTFIATVSWFFECIALWLILHGVGATTVTIGQAGFIFCMATIFGGFLFFLPGGLGGFEASMMALLTLLGIENFQAVPAVFITRACTLFFSVGLGFLFILVTSMRYRKALAWEEFEAAEKQSAEPED
jgi:uncharacterized protein (TIRG00374 family)